MKLVATSDFRNPDVNTIDVGNDKIADLHVHKGARFDIGGELPFDKLNAAQKRLVVELNASGRIVEVSQKDKVEAIDKEVASEAKKVETAKAAKK